MFLARDMQWVRDMRMLPVRIQNMHEPLLWMVWSMRLKLVWWRGDWILTRWRGVVSTLMSIWSVLLLRIHTKGNILRAIVLLLWSFASYQLFWRAYRKQLIGLFLFSATWFISSRRRWMALPVARATLLISKTTRIIIFLRWIWVVFQAIRSRSWLPLIRFIGLRIWAIVLALPLLIQMRDTQIVWLIQPFIASVDIPDLGAWFQAWGTFLTLQEYRTTAFPLMLLALVWLIVCYKKSKNDHWSYVIRMIVALSFWVIGQLFFFQRMIATRDLFIVIGAVWGSMWFRSRWKRMRLVIWAIVMTQWIVTGYRILRTYPALITPEEFAFLQQIGTSLPSNAVVIVPGIDYSPRVQWRTQRDVLAPGLFDLNRRGTLDQQRTSKRLQISATEKCSQLRIDYPELINRPVYMRIWNKQPISDIDWFCFVPLQKTSLFTRYRVQL